MADSAAPPSEQEHASASVIQYFKSAAAQRPNDPAIHFVSSAETQWTSTSFRQLDCASGYLAQQLLQLAADGLVRGGTDPNDVIPFAVCTGVDMHMAVVAQIAALKAGVPYVPLSLQDPKTKTNHVLSTAKVRVVMCDETARVGLEQRLERSWDELLGPGGKLLCLQQLDHHLGSQNAELDMQSATSNTAVLPEAIVHVIFTSGSTGNAKGVCGTHRGMMNRFTWMWNRFPFQPDDVCCARAEPTFIDSVWESLGPLCRGVPLVMIPAGDRKDLRSIVEHMQRHDVTRLLLVPSQLRVLLMLAQGADQVADLGSVLPLLRLLTSSGESLPQELCQQTVAALRPQCTFLNLYGTTEEAGDVTVAEYKHEQLNGAGIKDEGSFVGVPLPNCKVLILDSNQQGLLCDDGVQGEVVIAGHNTAAGYLNNAEETHKSFVSLHPSLGGGVGYAPGDVGYLDENGGLHLKGRSNRVVKMRGQKVVLDDVEATIEACEHVEAAAVCFLDGSHPKLVALVKPENIELAALRAELKLKIDDPANIPRIIMLLSELPKLSNGKKDRMKLDCLAQDAEQSFVRSVPELERPQGATETMVARVMEQVLKEPAGSIGRNLSWFELGINSITSLEALVKLGLELPAGVKLSTGDFTLSDSVVALAKLIQQGGSTGNQTHVLSGVHIESLNVDSPDALIQEALTLATEEFANRLPAYVACGVSVAESDVVVQLSKDASLESGLSFAVRDDDTNVVIGTYLIFDITKQDPEQMDWGKTDGIASLEPTLIVLDELGANYAKHRLEAAIEGEVVESFIVVIKEGYNKHGASLLEYCEMEVIERAREAGFKWISSQSFNSATENVHRRMQYTKLEAIHLPSKEINGTKPFASMQGGQDTVMQWELKL